VLVGIAVEAPQGERQDVSSLRFLWIAIPVIASSAFAQVPPPAATPPTVLPSPAATLPSMKGTDASARAADIAAKREEAQAKCWADLEVLCPGIESRQDRVRCIRDNRAKLPASCRQARRSRGPSIRTACAADAEKLCKDVAAGRARFKCLVDHRPDVSEGCGVALDTRRKGAGPVREQGTRATP
jgi:hypothetical protein